MLLSYPIDRSIECRLRDALLWHSGNTSNGNAKLGQQAQHNTHFGPGQPIVIIVALPKHRLAYGMVEPIYRLLRSVAQACVFNVKSKSFAM